MKKAALYLFFLGLLGAGQGINAYELATHGILTSQAYQRSTLSTDSARLKDLGFDPASANAFGRVYYDVFGAQIRERLASLEFEGTIIGSLGVAPLSVAGWLMRGAIREDDAPGEENPQDDPFNSNLKRPLHHFYDPVFHRPLTVLGVSLGQRSPDWAIGSRDAFVQPNTPEAGRRNHFTIFDAREAMYRALTGHDSQGNPLQPVTGGTLTKQSDIRNAYWATTFRALGSVLHLNQDMAQPQHTRNDPHSGKGPGIVQALLTGHTSVFEKYIEARATGAQSYQIDGAPLKPLPLDYDGDPIYPIPAFTRYSDFWSTREGIAGRGLADYSNRGFFTFGTNLGSNPYTSPSNNAAGYERESATGLAKQPQQVVNFLRGDVHDTLNTGSTANIRLTTESVFDVFLGPAQPTYSLNRFNYDHMADLLIPRAVAYSTGLINYFFRNPLFVRRDSPITWSGSGPGLFLTVFNFSVEEMEGTFALYAIYGKGSSEETRSKVLDLEDPEQGKVVKLSGSHTFQFQVPADHRPTAHYLLVFRGRLGQEPDAVLPVMIDVPLVIVVQNSTSLKPLEALEVSSACGPFPPSTNPLREGVFCWWSPTRPYAVSGRLLKNTSAPIVDRVGATVGSSFVELWRRSTPDEPDPSEFSVIIPTAAPGPQPIAQLTIELVNDFDIHENLLTLQSANSFHGKFLQSIFNGATGTFSAEVSKRRGVGASYRVLNDLPRMGEPAYETLTVSDVKPGENIFRTEQEPRDRFVGVNFFSETLYDFYRAGLAPEEARTLYDPLVGPYVDPQTTQGPRITWEHTVRRKYAEAEREFLRLVFGEAPAITFRITATER